MNILVIHHERNIADCVVEILHEHGYHALPLYNVREALDHLPKIQFDLALISSLMPGLSGDELGDFYRREVFQPNCKVILIGTEPGVDDMKSQRPEFGYLTLPFEKEDLLRMVREAQT
jgi:DNA-binding NtrC family response regulator